MLPSAGKGREGRFSLRRLTSIPHPPHSQPVPNDKQKRADYHLLLREHHVQSKDVVKMNLFFTLAIENSQDNQLISNHQSKTQTCSNSDTLDIIVNRMIENRPQILSYPTHPSIPSRSPS